MRDSKVTRYVAQKAFNAYNEYGPTPWKTFDGRDVPKWDELNDAVRDKWIAATDKAIQEWVDMVSRLEE